MLLASVELLVLRCGRTILGGLLIGRSLLTLGLADSNSRLLIPLTRKLASIAKASDPKQVNHVAGICHMNVIFAHDGSSSTWR
jgi:hypothetical protein